MRESSATARNFEFGDSTIYASSRPLLRFIRKLLNPILKLFFNPNPMIEALHIQARLNESYNQSEALSFELTHNLVLELTRTSIEVRNLKMRLESMASRLDFDERRARALEGVVQYRPGAVPPLQPPADRREQQRARHRGQRAASAPPAPAGDAGVHRMDAEGYQSGDRRTGSRRARRLGARRPRFVERLGRAQPGLD